MALGLTGPVSALLGVEAPKIQLIGSCGVAMNAVANVAASMVRL